MSSPLPNFLDPWRAVDNRSVFAGCLPLSSLPRLCELLLDAVGDVRFRLVFFRDEEHRPVLRCEVVTTLKLRCQRCLEAIDLQVDTSQLLALVTGIDEARRLPEHYDPLLVSDKQIRPRDLIEDELLLALPQIPMHEPNACVMQVRELNRVQMRSGRRSPFAVLSELEREG